MKMDKENETKNFYNFFGRFPHEYEAKLNFIQKKTYRSKINILKCLIDKEFEQVKNLID